MKAKKVNIFFAVIFTAFLVTPALLTIAGEKVDVAIFFGVNEEESETEENEIRNLIELDEFVHIQLSASDTFEQLHGDNIYYLATFKELHLESIYPPPEHSI